MSAALVGVRSYTELPLLADQSSRMYREMEVARIRIQKIDLAESLASQVMGSEIATVMLQDIQWLNQEARQTKFPKIRTCRIKGLCVAATSFR